MKAQKKGNYLHRKEGTRGSGGDRFLIVCEGTETEPRYFKSFPVPSKDVVIVGTGDNTLNVVEVALVLRAEAKRNDEPYDQVWVVFDKDSFPAENFNNAIYKAEAKGLLVAESNEAFELWFILHYNLYHTAITRRQYNHNLSEILCEKYDKACRNMYDRLKGKEPTAIANAYELMKRFPSGITPSEKKPFTRVHLLVEQLIKFSRK